MPIPKPAKGQSQDDFIESCMSNETMKKEYEDNDQRLAICFSSWKQSKEKKSMENNKVEYRNYPVVEIRVQRDNDGNKDRIVGYAAVFDSLSEDLGGFREKIAPGAFAKSIKKSDVRALWNHDPNYVLGRTKSKTLKLKEDEHGLLMEVMPPRTQWANDLMVSIERGDVSQQSFGFRVITDEWDDKGDEKVIRTLKEVNLIDVSPVTYPAYPDTEVALRSLAEWKASQQLQPDVQGDKSEQDEKVTQGRKTNLLRKRLELKLKTIDLEVA